MYKIFCAWSRDYPDEVISSDYVISVILDKPNKFLEDIMHHFKIEGFVVHMKIKIEGDGSSITHYYAVINEIEHTKYLLNREKYSIDKPIKLGVDDILIPISKFKLMN